MADEGAVAFGRRRLADVVEERAQARQQVRRRRFDRQQGVAEDVVGVVSGLGDALAGGDLGQDDREEVGLV